MKNAIKLLVVLALALAVFGQYETASAGGMFRFRGQVADASFTSFDPSGCIQTDVGVFPSEGVSGSPPGPGGSGSGVGMFISVFDHCNGTQLLAADGFTELPDPEFQVFGQLESATLNATVPLFDFVSGTEFSVSVVLIWTGNGPLTRESGSFRSHSPGCSFHSRFRGTFRPAYISGSVWDGVTNFTPDPGWGRIGNVSNADLTIGCN